MNLKLGHDGIPANPRRGIHAEGIEGRTQSSWRRQAERAPPRRAPVAGLVVGGVGEGFFGGGFLTDASNNVLDEVINTLLLAGVHRAEAKFGLALRTLAGTNGKRTTKIVFDEGRS